METQIAYSFASATEANRFLNELKPWSKAKVKASLYRGDSTVKVSYEYDGHGFDSTCSELDDLASRYNGSEVAVF